MKSVLGIRADSISGRNGSGVGISLRGLLKSKETADNGDILTGTDSGTTLLVMLRPDSESRKDFRRFCRANAVVWEVVETIFPDNDVSRETGKGKKDPRRKVTETQSVEWIVRVIGSCEAINRLANMPFVENWDYVRTAKAPRTFTAEQDERVDSRLPDPFGRCPKDVSAAVREEYRLRRQRLSSQTEAESRRLMTDKELKAEERQREKEARAIAPRTDEHRESRLIVARLSRTIRELPDPTPPGTESPIPVPVPAEPSEDAVTQELLRLPAFKADPNPTW